MKDGKKYILVADDDPQLRQVLELLLTAEGYEVCTAADGLQAESMIDPQIDLYILDVGMPGQTGILTAAAIRKKQETPIIFLTAYSGESDKVMGFSVGADDYIVKPFSNAELLMRIRAILRRSGAAAAVTEQENRLQIHDAVLDLDRQCILRGEETIGLTYTEFKILELLVSHRKKIYSLENIYSSIWDDNAVGDSSRNAVYIKTAWGKGYYID